MVRRKLSLFIYITGSSFSLCAMEAARSKAGKYVTRPKKNDAQAEKKDVRSGTPTYSSAILAMSQGLNSIHLKKMAKIAARFTSKDHPTAQYFRASLETQREKKDARLEVVADNDVNRPSEAVKETNKDLYIKSVELAHQNWSDIGPFRLQDNEEGATVCIKVYEAELEKAQIRYFKYLRSEKYETSTPNEEALKEEVKVHFLEILHDWNLETAAFYWNRLELKTVILSKDGKQAFYNRLLEHVAPATIALVNEPNPKEAENAISLLEPITERPAAAEIPSSPPRRRASNVDLYKRTTVDGEKHGSYEFSGEQFMKHISAARNYLRALLQNTNAVASQEALESLVTSVFEKIRKDLSESLVTSVFQNIRKD